MSHHHYWTPEVKSRFRMWKSGKKWLFGATLIAASFLGGEVQALAEEVDTNPSALLVIPTDTSEQEQDATTIVDPNGVLTAPAVVIQSSNPTGPQSSPVSEDVADPGLSVGLARDAKEVDQLTADQVVKAQQEVRIHYTPFNGDETPYYAWVWGDKEEYRNEGRFLELQKEDSNRRTVVLTPDKTVTSFGYILTNGNHWADQPRKISGEENMTAPVNNVTAVDIYHGADGWYSQFQNLQTDEFDRKFGYTDKVINAQGQFETVGSAGNLGATLHEDGRATINLWAPTAEKVKLNVYRSTAETADLLTSLEMTRGNAYNPTDHTKNTVGLWSLTLDSSNLEGLQAKDISYDYTLTIPKAYFIQKREHWEEEPKGSGNWKKKGDVYANSAKTDEIVSGTSPAKIAGIYVGEAQTVTTQDPYSFAPVKNGKRSVIVDPSKIGQKVTNSNNQRVDKSTELSVLEVDIRDFSIDPNSGVTEANRGNYLGFVQEGTTNPKTGTITGIDYLKYLGAKYVQMMPIYDFQTVPELPKDDPNNNVISSKFSADDQQNWGYDPKNYNVPEGSYSTDPDDPENRIQEVKTMVQKLHDAGINIIMDVVYNHLYDGQNNPFEYTVPGYYYAVNGDGKMNNDIGVGNAVRTNSEMMRQYIVNSVAYWALEYGMDGFRFDAMSDLDTKTMNAIRTAINKIDKRIVTYGEGWDSMGNYLAKDGDKPASVANAKETPEVGFFDSVGRDAIAGSHYDNENPRGFVNKESKFISDAGHVTTLANSLMGGHGYGRSFINASQQLNYVEVHDGMTLNDLLKHYNGKDDPDHLNRVELATAMSALSQGIHFSQHGQEFLRTKENSHNTYNAGDQKNKIDWDLISTNADAVNFTKSLISLRQNEALWHLSDYQNEVFKHMTITNAQAGSGIITYELKHDNGDKYLVVFNNNTSSNDNHSLTLGGDNWYYGSKEGKGKGEINETNDFSNAYIVTTNSKGLYDKIGKVNGEKTITLDKLTATVLYIPKVELVSKDNLTQTINYVNKQGGDVASDNVQKATKVIVEQTDLDKKFSYVRSGIGASSKKVLGFEKNVLDNVAKDFVKKQTVYYATDTNGKPVEVTGNVTLDPTGKPVSTDMIKWITESPLMFAEVTHPSVNGYQVVASTEASKDLTKVPALALDNRDVTVTYAKESVAYLVSTTDPDRILPTAKDSVAADSAYTVKGLEGESIQLTSNLDREGYTFTVNGQASLQEAIADQNQGKFVGEETVYTVTYAPKDAQVSVIYIDTDIDPSLGQKTNDEPLSGKVGEVVAFTPDIPSTHLLVSNNYTEDMIFDRKDDAKTPSQTIRVTIRQKEKRSQLDTTYTISYQGTEMPIEDKVLTVTWDVVENRETGKTSYTATKEQEVLTPAQEGYRPDKVGVVILAETKAEAPSNQQVVVTYTKVEKPRTAFETNVTYVVDGQEVPTLPDATRIRLDKKEVVIKGEDAVYTWNPHTFEWDQVRAAVTQVEKESYRSVVPALKLENTAKVKQSSPEKEDVPATTEPEKEAEDPRIHAKPKTAPTLEDLPEAAISEVEAESPRVHSKPDTAPTLEDLPEADISDVEAESPRVHAKPKTAPTLEDLPVAVISEIEPEAGRQPQPRFVVPTVSELLSTKKEVTSPINHDQRIEQAPQPARPETQATLPHTGSKENVLTVTGLAALGLGLVLVAKDKKERIKAAR